MIKMTTTHKLRKSRGGPILGLAVMLCLLPRPALAQAADGSASSSDAERAAALFAEGKADVAADKLHDALRAFRDAWEISKTSEVAANLAAVEVAFGHHRDAAEHFRFALSHLSPSATAEQKQAIVSGLDTEKAQVLTLVIQGAPVGARISIDGVVIGSAPLTDDVYVEPRPHDVHAEAAGFESVTRSIGGPAGTTLAVQLDLKPTQTGPHLDTSASQPPLVHLTTKPNSIPLLVGGGVAVVGAAIGTIFWVKASHAENDATSKRNALPPGNNTCGTGTPYDTECKDLHDANNAVDRNRNISLAGFIGGGAAAAGTVLYWLWPRKPAASVPIGSAIVAPGYAAIRASWSW